MCFANFFAGIVQDQIIVELDIRNKTFTWQLLKLLLHYLIICTCSRDDRNYKQLILIDTFDSLVDTVRFSGQTKKIFLDSYSILQHMSSAIIETVFYNQMVRKSLIYSWVADFVRRRFHSVSLDFTFVYEASRVHFKNSIPLNKIEQNRQSTRLSCFSNHVKSFQNLSM